MSSPAYLIQQGKFHWF